MLARRIALFSRDGEANGASILKVVDASDAYTILMHSQKKVWSTERATVARRHLECGVECAVRLVGQSLRQKEISGLDPIQVGRGAPD